MGIAFPGLLLFTRLLGLAHSFVRPMFDRYYGRLTLPLDPTSYMESTTALTHGEHSSRFYAYPYPVRNLANRPDPLSF